MKKLLSVRHNLLIAIVLTALFALPALAHIRLRCTTRRRR
jgi:hypothetical protein